ncbi:pre-mRNA-splicing factor SYF1 [Chloropicon primus]|uniref:Pre-mRNA-splicing factor SYF1 n=2 Tax=Chloropicon primus TaxID=1764295 RepID=A0A5B8MK35_9CHLO|nr:pre-mRNA-splicing factor SYF1 [Chloropicon primus]|eukprot:QDZ20836.1 pre-mRNA-splicing factor SYF1 [Chloropicon primus]
MASSSSSRAVQALTAALSSDPGLLRHEEELLRGPGSLQSWLAYLEAAPASARTLVYERSLRAFPGSYKLWRAYLGHALASEPPLAPGRVSALFERALCHMHKYPVVWRLYLEFLLTPRGARCSSITRTRRAFDRSLRSLPVTQHAEWVWPLYLRFASRATTPWQTGARVYRRYLKLEPGHREEYVAFCRGRGLHGEAAGALAEALRDRSFASLAGKTRHELWLELVDLLVGHGAEAEGLDAEAVLRSGLRTTAKEMSGRLYTALADYHVRRGAFSQARDAYVEGIEGARTARDFALVFDAYARYLESMISALMEEEEEGGDDDSLDLLMAVLEDLVASRPVLLNACLLRQNPDNVREWLRRAEMVPAEDAPGVYARAVTTCAPRAPGHNSLWVAFARLYEDSEPKDLPQAREVFRRAVGVEYRTPEDLAAVWCAWVEMEIRAGAGGGRALEVAREAVAQGSACRKSQRCWMLLADLTESLCTLEETKAVYGEMIDHKLATPQVVLNFASVLEEARHYEEAFKAYERGVSAFRPPHSSSIWRAYLGKFVGRYGGRRVERARELFEGALDAAEAPELAELYRWYASFEEEHGLAKNVMTILGSALKVCPAKDKLGVLTAWVAKAKEFYGVARVRQIYQGAIEVEPPEGLGDADVRTVCLRYARLERGLGEIDRARAILRHGSQLANPKERGSGGAGYWEEWNKFEVSHGNEDTFREMLRVKRSVAAFYGQGAASSSAAPAAAGEKPSLPGFVKAETMNQGGGAQENPAAAEEEGNPEDIDIDDDEEEKEKEEKEEVLEAFEIKQKAVPQDVFGSLQPPSVANNKRKDSEKKKPFLGAAERFKRAKTTTTQ